MIEERKIGKVPLYERENDVLYIRLPREFDHYSARNMRVETDALIAASSIHNIVFDFTRTDFMDSTGIGILMGRYKRMKASKGSVYIWHVNQHIRRMLEAAGIFSLIQEIE